MFSFHTLRLLVRLDASLTVPVCLSHLADHLHPFMVIMHPQGSGLFHQGNAPPHRAVVRTWLEEHASPFTGNEPCGISFGCCGNVLYCNTTWDGLSCWPTTVANSVKTISCFPVLNEVLYDISHNATRYCNENGQWANKSDYSACRPLLHEDDMLQLLWDVKEAGTIYYVGYGMSLVALTLALWIFFYFRDLRCLRNTIHTNLMVTYILIDLTWIITATLLSSTNPTSKKAACFLVIFLTYLLGTNYFWMFVEGLYLYILVVKTFSVEHIKIALFFVTGWGIPAIVVIIWASVKSYFALSGDDRVSPECIWQVRDNYDYIFMCPVVTVLVVNCFFLGKIMYVLITKLRAANTAESKQYRKAAKALLVLIPLLGITYIIVLVTPSERAARVVFTYLQATLLSTQGFTVAVLYCFLNGEVRNSMRHHLERWKTQRTLSNAHHHSVKYGAVGSGNNPCAEDSVGARDRDSCISMTTTTICINTHCNKCSGLGDNNGCSYCAANFRDEMV